ncbi:elongation factor P maturation arginine rhamnosyltransferase EarP [Litorivivens sp.]|uniref:elongation factor P maturation arginine rhamnosyltransferase EarP n=1 Tax=Litorivivens sp. TaxID=2020868 RepID=UPI003564BD49
MSFEPSPTRPATPKPTLRWDIFCHVIDNFGDIGVSWRLARQLAQEHHQSVQLWVDDLSALTAMEPSLTLTSESQLIHGVQVRYWPDTWCQQQVADVVVEAFGCTLPAPYLDLMATTTPRVLWLNLEYLSAEDWVEQCHGLTSKVGNRFQKYFFFPGFTDKTGGLLREENLIAQRHQFQSNRREKNAFLNRLGLHLPEDALCFSLFSYENPGLHSWLDALSQAPKRVHLLVPQGRILQDLQRWLGVDALGAGDSAQRGALDIHILPFLSQDDYDRLLWCCALNIVRGEDSFVRAQWAGSPMLWHIYPQPEDAHQPKLQAFLTLYLQGLSADAADALKHFWLAWNTGANLADSWARLSPHWSAIQGNAQRWCNHLARQKNISQQLVTFAEKQIIFAPRNLS